MDKRTLNEKKFHYHRFLDGIGYRPQERFYKCVLPAYIFARHLVEDLASKGGCGLEYGCSVGDNLIDLLSKFDFYAVGIDISSTAIIAAEAKMINVSNRGDLHVMDANMPEFEDSFFDFCFGFGVLHHLIWPESILQMRRILKSDANFLFIEPLGTNPIINLYRFFTPKDRSEDELPLKGVHLKQLKHNFSNLDLHYYGFLTLLLFNMNKESQRFKILLSFLGALDKQIFKVPGLWRLAWVVIVIGKK
jgi:ubiquinone/menaquinone biosynthesis C-methylase UbiE